ncbi:MAG: hypothetical protein IJW02_06350 [Clostridia bacterium]|nr:hypothetical protein [Clostridia bacterium]
MTKRKNVYALIAIALVFLFNPNVNLIDILPDCVAYLLLIFAIGRLHETVPYLAECKGALVKLTLVTLIKIPAFSVMYANMGWGKDIVPLFTLVFVALELILLYSAVENCFRALGYIGERTDCASVRDPYTIGKRSATPEALRVLTYIFLIARAVLNLIPEIMLLTPEDTELRRKLQENYPAVLVICIITAIIIGIVWLVNALGYVKAIRKKGDLKAAIDSLKVHVAPEEMSVKERVKKLNGSLSLLAISSLFIFDITLSDFGGYNILPHFIYGILLFFAIYSLSVDRHGRICITACAGAYSLVSMLCHFFTLRFFDSFTYADLRYSDPAKADYMPVKIFTVFEVLILILFLAVCVKALIGFIRENTDVSPTDPTYTRTNERNHKRLSIRASLILCLSAIINLLKGVNVFLKQFTTVIYSDANSEGIVASSAPYMDTLIFFISLGFVIYSFVTVSNLKDEVKFKYDKDS